MKKIVFLHGSGADQIRYADFMDRVAKYYDVEMVWFDAPFQHYKKLDKHQGFGKFDNNGRRDAVIDDYMYSLRYIKDKIHEIDCDTKDIALLGHSQGGGMAVHVGLGMELAGVMAICPDLPYNISYKLSSKTPIYWFEAANDTLLDRERKDSYKLLHQNINFHYTILPNCGHNDFGNNFMDIIRQNKIHCY